MKMKWFINVFAVFAMVASLVGASIGLKPQVAQAFPSVNPMCWIMDNNFAYYKKNCRSHDISWPHVGGGGVSSDWTSPLCGGQQTAGQGMTLSANDLAAFNINGGRATYGFVEYLVVMIDKRKVDRSFRQDWVRYTWQSQSAVSINYNNGGFWKNYRYTYDSYSVVCDRQGHLKQY